MKTHPVIIDGKQLWVSAEEKSKLMGDSDNWNDADYNGKQKEKKKEKKKKYRFDPKEYVTTRLLF
jgi:hypothetical protein